MSTPYLGEIRVVGFNFNPVGWYFCDGSLLSIEQNEALFNLLGTTYGGDGVSTFALPDLRGRIPLHQGSLYGNTYLMGEAAGASNVTLTESQMPQHSHLINATTATGNSKTPSNAIFAASAEEQYASGANTTLAASILQSFEGGGQPHTNQVPYLCMNFIIASSGVYPSQN